MRNFARIALAGVLVLSFGFAGAFPAASADHCDPRNPDCKHDQEQNPKAHCSWTRVGAPGTAGTFGGDPANQVVTLHCPNHILVKVDWGYKDCRSPIAGECDGLTAEPIVTDLGQAPDPTGAGPCNWQHSWHVYAPNINVFTFYMKAVTYKDADCDGAADDWNRDVVNSDGTLGCYWQNYYGPKWYENPQGWYYPYFAPPFGPTPDGLLTYCDYQVYEIQWRQFN